MNDSSRAGGATGCSVRRDGTILHVAGDIDASNWSAVAERITAAVSGGVVEVDLTRLAYCGADGVRALLRGFQARRPAGTVRLICAPKVYRVLRICDLVNMDGLVVSVSARPPRTSA